MISAFFFGVTEPGIYGIALPNKRAFVVACLSSAVGGAIVGMTGALMYISGGLGVFNLLNFIDGTPGIAGISHDLRDHRLARLCRPGLCYRVHHLPAQRR